MPDPNELNDDNAVPGAPDPAAGPEAAPAAEAGDAEVTPEQLKQIIMALQAESEGLRDQNLRLLADMENLRKRTEREREETAKYAISKFARDIVTVADNFERAVQAVPPGAADADPALQSLVEGVTMTERELLNVLERNGVKRIVPKGEPFNPHHHQAMMEVENALVAPGTVLEVFQAGYMIDERVLRPAMVVVAKGGQKAEKAEAPQTPQDNPG